ncbi:MAG: CotH kinase family protein [Lachnospiraceae bacterium]|nr:CotH kinase family protein [Lachnospiraceae bacterium]
MMKNKKLILPSIMILLIISSVTIASHLYRNKHIIDEFSISIPSISEKISFYNTDNCCYLFLPSGCNTKKLSLNRPKGYSTSKEPFSSEIVINHKYNFTIFDPFGIEIFNKPLIIMKSSDIPSLHLTLNNTNYKDFDSDNKRKCSGSSTLIDTDGTILLNDNFAKLSSHGNSSWWHEKKPFNLTYDSPIKLLNDNEAISNYVLIANFDDESFIRNKMIYDYAYNTGITTTPNSQYVDLYINNEYLGLYLLSERVSVDSNVVNINSLDIENKKASDYSSAPSFDSTTENSILHGYDFKETSKDISGGYLLEFDDNERALDSKNMFVTKNHNNILLSSPTKASKNQLNYISSLCNKIEDQLYSNDITNTEIFDYLDLSSWAKYYLIQEVFANQDRASFLMYKNSDEIDSKIYAGPIWDFDMSCGNFRETNQAYPSSFCVNTWGWYKQLYHNAIFKSEIQKQYKTEIRPYILNKLSTDIDNIEAQISNSFAMNKARWNGILISEKTEHYETLEEYTNAIKNFMKTRTSFLDSVWLNDVETVNIYAHAVSPQDKNVYTTIFQTIPKDTILDNTISSDSRFETWIDESTSEEFDFSQTVNSDKSLLGIWTYDEIHKNDQNLPLTYRIKKIIKTIFPAIIIITICVLMLFIYSKKKIMNINM